MSDKSEAWKAVWDLIHDHNPTFHEREESGLDCVLIEIRRLQASDTILAKAAEELKIVEREIGVPSEALKLMASSPPQHSEKPTP